MAKGKKKKKKIKLPNKSKKRGEMFGNLVIVNKKKKISVPIPLLIYEPDKTEMKDLGDVGKW